MTNEIKRFMAASPTANHEVSVPEKEMLCIILDKEPMLAYPTHELRMDNGTTETEYEIPEEAKQGVLEALYPFKQVPSLDEELFDIHEQKNFAVRDFRVIRCRDRNMLVSPYFPCSGGMVVDWMPKDGGNLMVDVKKPSGKGKRGKTRTIATTTLL